MTTDGDGPVDPSRESDPSAGRGIVQADAVGTALFVATAVVEAILLRHWTEVIGVAVALGLFALGCGAFLLGYGRAIQRSRTDEISVASLFLLIGPAVPVPVKRRLGLLLGLQVAVAVATAVARPFTTLAFGVLVPVFGLGCNGLWAARHGRFPPRPVAIEPAKAPPARPARARPAKRAGPVADGEDPQRGGEMEQNAGHG